MHKKEKALQGVGGWLALLILGLVFLGPLFGFALTGNDLREIEQNNPNLIGSSAWSNVKLILWATYATQTALSVNAGLRLKNEFRPSSVRYAIIVLWCNNLVLSIFPIVVASSILFADGSAIGTTLVIPLASGMLNAGVWTAYLLSSKRVKNTYYGGRARTSEPHQTENTSQDELVGRNSPTNGSLELYDRRVDWMLCYLLVLIPIWLLYNLNTAVAVFPAFLLTALLKPLRRRLETLMKASVFSAGACLFLSPLLQVMVEVDFSGAHFEWFRNIVLPLAGMGFMASSWFGYARSQTASISNFHRSLRWGALLPALIVGLIGVLFAHDIYYEATEDVAFADERLDAIIEEMGREQRKLESENRLAQSKIDNNFGSRNLGGQERRTPAEMREKPSLFSEERRQILAPMESDLPPTAANPSVSSVLKFSVAEQSVLKGVGWQISSPDGPGCMIERTNGGALNYVMIYQGSSTPKIELSINHHRFADELSGSGGLAIVVDRKRIPAQVQSTTRWASEIEIPYSLSNRSALANARSIVLVDGTEVVVRESLDANPAAAHLIERCLQLAH